jgi:AhpD family alkylhydroperoxidase
LTLFEDCAVSTFKHIDLMRDINASLAPFRKSQGTAMAGFGQLAKAAITDGALGAKHKELVALAIAVTQRCSGCIGFHVKALVQLGCTRAELEEMLSVCVYMGGGPALMYAAEAIAAWDEMAPAEPA